MPRRRGLLLGGLGALAIHPVRAQQDAFHTREVPYVPSAQVTVDEMLRLAEVGPQDFVIDLGSGDGRIVVTAAKKFGARGLGVDIDWRLVAQAEENARQAGVADRAKFVEQDLFKTDFSQATVITTFLFPFVMLKLRPRLLEMKPGTRIVSNEFDFGDWRPDRRTGIRKNVYLWIVPARVAGRWQARLELPPIERLLELEIKQRYQEVSAHARLNGVPAPVWDMQLEGDRVRFVVVDSTDRDDEAGLYFDGRVSGDLIEGELARGVGMARRVARWRAVRFDQ